MTAFILRPRIISENGNLIFKTGENKNIRFVTQGNSKIYLNDGDLTNAANLARNASETLQRVNVQFYDTYFQVQKFMKVIEGKSGILSRLSVLEADARNATNGTSLQRGRFPVLNTRIRLLRRKVNRILRLLNKNECSSSPCKNSGTCQDLFNGYICKCPDEWEGLDCDRDVNECARFAGTDLGCQNGATCINKQGTYECQCTKGWYGIHCTRQSVSCTTGSVAELCGHGTCLPQNNNFGYKCLCDQGWTTDGTNPACLVDVDECKLNTPPCSNNPPVSCENTPGSFRCAACPEGYRGNGYYCVDIDECANFNGGCSTNPLVHCINTPGSRVCGACPPGYVGDGISCAFRGVCAINNGGCHYLAQCRDNPSISSTYVECVCPTNYVGTGIGINGCVQSTQVSNACASNPCVFGTCIPNNSSGSYICQCRRKYTGRNCNIRKNPCEPNPCANGGTCRALLDISFTCMCTTSYTGTTCETQKQACGGFLLGTNGTVKYPQTHSRVLDSTVSCAWIIRTNVSKILNVTFTHFNLKKSGNCRYDWLQIHDGSSTVAQSFGRFCGTNLPNGGNIVSTHHEIYLWLRIDSDFVNSGFELTWTSTVPVCGGIVKTDSHGTIRSPGYPGNYPINRDCYWYITAPLGKRIQFHFFSLIIGSSSNCTNDYLTFYQGLLETDRILARYCNTTHPEPLYSAGPEVLIHFHSDSSKTYPGFQISYSAIESIPGCGGVYTAHFGELSSPIENGRYPPDLICEYKIQVPQNTRIKITFISFNLEEESNCLYDSVAVHEGGSSSAPLVNRYCGTRLPPSYTSIGNQLFIMFTSDWSNTEDTVLGFRLRYEMICGGIYSEPTGTIQSPGYPDTYQEDQICVYEIIQPLHTTITLTFTDFELEASTQTECLFDFVEIRDGDNENSTLIGQYCEERPPFIQSTYNYLWIKFESDSSVSGDGFKANYSTTNIGCGGILKANSGIITSSTDAGSYLSDSTCMWVIVAPQQYIIQLKWLTFALEESSICEFDYVEVYNNHTAHELIGKYCGSKLPPTIISGSNIVTIKFVSDKSYNFEGFSVSYTFVSEETACGGKYFTSSGVIKSPFYPKNDITSRDCVWIITVKYGQQLLLNVTDFVLESYTGCAYDYLEIRNGGTSSSPLIGKYCGTNIPKEIPSHANQMYLHFHSDSPLVVRGFKITWESAATGCGGVLTSPKGSIISPFYPESYNENTDCFWKISVSAGSTVQIVFVDIELENHSDCLLDYVELLDGPNTNSKSLGKFCQGMNGPSVESSSNVMSVLFRVDESFQGRGFHIQYNTVCKTTLTGFRGAIESPNYPNKYPFDVDCTWTIKVPQGNKINITFAHFELEEEIPSLRCRTNFLEVSHKGERDNMIHDVTYCGNKFQFVRTVNSAISEVHFVSSPSIIGRGFRLEWQIEGCGGILKRPFGRISSPNYPHTYPPRTQCDWLIQLDYGLSVEVTFFVLDFGNSGYCNVDNSHILIFNGVDDSYPILSMMCNQAAKPITVTSSGNSMYIRFVSYLTHEGTGFWANYTSTESRCGGKLTTLTGSIHSPNYPQNYGKNDSCEWFINMDGNHGVELSFYDLDLSDDCTTDFIKVYDGPSAGYPLLDELCGKTKPSKIKSTRNYMTIEFQSGSKYTAKGFLANFTMSCGTRIESQYSGIISVDGSTLSSLGLQNCSWTIVNKSPSQRVTLVITHIQFLEWEGPLKIYNGESAYSPLIATIENNKLPQPIMSGGNALHVEVNNFSKDFAAKYYMVDTHCGGIFTAESGFLATPGYPNSYPLDIQCEWTIQVAVGNRIGLAFKTFDLLSSENCHLVYVEIRDSSNNGKLLGTYCNEVPAYLENVGSLWVLFKSTRAPNDDSGATGRGFLAEYSLTHGISLSGATGTIASPLYPKYFYNAEYFWTITVTFGKAVLVTFLDFSIELVLDEVCFLTAMKIYDGYDSNAPLLAELCGVRIPSPIKSTSNVLSIKVTDSSVNRGSKFLLEWMETDIPTKESTSTNQNVTGCGSKEIIEISSNSQKYNLTSPGYPYGYAENLRCEWIFSTKPTYHVVVTFLKIDLEVYSDNCLADFVKIYKKGTEQENWILLSTVCYPNQTAEGRIHGSDLVKIVFETDAFVNGTGFEARVRKMCGGTLTDIEGTISVDPSEFKYMVSCEWNVTVRAGRTIQVNFQELNLQANAKDDSCESYILLKNGHIDSPLLGIGKYCENTIPPPLNTTGNYLYVKYFGFPGKSFQLSYEEVSQNCGGLIMLSDKSKETTISSPNYPNIPPPFTECYWTIRAPPGESLRVDFLERFDVTASKDCKKAAVEIRDGGSKFSPLIDQYCVEMPNSTFSTDNMITIRFFTNFQDPGNGFKAKIVIADCGGVIRSEKGELKSPNFNMKSMYPQNSDCTWHLIGPLGHYLVLKFDVIDLPKGEEDCLDLDHVTLEEDLKFNDSLNNIGVYCGNSNPGEIRSSTNEVIVRFVSGNKGSDVAGFSLTYNSSHEKCGDVLNTENGIIRSPGYPVSSYSDIECRWTIEVPEGRRITLKFNDFDLHTSVFHHGIGFYNDKLYKSLISYKTKKSNSTIPIKSSGNIMQILYWSSKSSAHRGFEAEYFSNELTVCKGTFNRNSGVITTINETTYYCQWKHVSSGSETLAITVTVSFDTPTPEISSCKYPTAVVIVTTDDENNEIAKLCTVTTQPVIVRSPYDVTKLIAYQNKYKSHLQYIINYATYPCGGIVSGQVGYITTPNYPQKYVGAVECAWILKLPENNKIFVNFENLDLDQNCDYNYISIYNGELPSSPKIKHICDNDKPTTLNAQGNVVLIEYHSDEKSIGKGFKIRYEPLVGGCGGIFVDKRRIIQTPAYPKDYSNNAECIWEIFVDQGYHINFEFIDRFYIEESTNCAKDFVEIWDYVDDVWVSLGKRCGRHTPARVNSTSNQMKIMFRTNENITATGFKAEWTSHCGGTFRASKKKRYIVSPGYPKNYNINLKCKYTIVPSDGNVNINFEDFAIEDERMCRFDNLTIQEDNEYDSPKTYCGTNTPAPVRTLLNVNITFVSDSWNSKRGFKFAYYNDDCGGVITKPTLITSETGPLTSEGQYAGGLNCYWNITAPPDKIVIIKFIHFELEHNLDCYYDYVEIFNGLNTNDSSKLATLCGILTRDEPIIRSESNSMTVHFKTDTSNHLSGFKALVYFNYGPSTGCGGTIKIENSNVLESPANLRDLDCQWQLITTKDYLLKIAITEINLSQCVSNQTFAVNNCSCNLIEVRDGGSLSEIIERICDDTVPNEITTTANMGWIRLYTLGTTKRKHFKAIVTKIPPTCGPSILTVTNKTQVLTSPGFPNPYPNNIKCKWTLMSDSHIDKFYLKFTDFDLIESSSSDFHSQKCSSDRVQIMDKFYHNVVTEGLGTDTVFSGTYISPVYSEHMTPVGVHEFCGKHALEYDLYFGSNTAIVSFVTGFNVPHGKGFRMEYVLAGCNRNYTSIQGRYTKSDTGTDNCVLTITVPRNYSISIYFMSFQLDDYEGCKKMSMEVYDGDSKSAPKLATLCGFAVPDPVYSTGNKVLINLATIETYYAEIDFIYTSSAKGRGCGGIFYNYVGKFTSPLYPKEYREASTCEWEIKVPQGMMVALKFIVFDINGASIDVTTFNKDNSVGVLHHYTQTDTPAIIRSENNRLTLKYTTTVNSGGSGWVVHFLAVTIDTILEW
ncbi:hypothetical protein FQA39_LY17492 [Lamprigera yunnana]|nr:hypothetical protein FQA39_LY17492 [Lamprigera yunnana]